MKNILAYHISPGPIIVNRLSSKTCENIPALLDWLIFSHTTVLSSCFQMVWDLSALVKIITQDLPEDIRLQLSRAPHKAKWGNYKLFFLSDKLFSVNKNGSEATFYDLAQYFPEDSEPTDLSSLQIMANRLQKAIEDLGAGETTTLSSPVAIFRGQEVLRKAVSGIPTIYHAASSHLGAFDLALKCTPREWVTNYQIGYFPKLWAYDLASAYPSQASRLLDLRDCDFSQAPAKIYSAYYGFVVGDFTVYPDHPYAFCSPFLADRGDGTLINFTGTKRNFVCELNEVRILQRYGLGEFKLDHGWFISPSCGVSPRVPFREFMTQLYKQRDSDELKSYLLKRTMTGLIGKLLETRRNDSGQVINYGDLYNPIYHALCTSGTRMQVFEFIIRHNITIKELVHIGVDGVKATRYIDLPRRAPMGQWRCTGAEPAIILSPGAILTAHRRFKQMDYGDFMVRCLEKPNSHIISKNKEDTINIRNLFINQTREFSQLPRTADDLINNHFMSTPVEL